MSVKVIVALARRFENQHTPSAIAIKTEQQQPHILHALQKCQSL